MSEYYDVDLKKARLAQIESSPGFTFRRIDLTDRGAVEELFERESPDRVISHAQLMKKVWHTDYVGDTRTLHVHICWLRRKIEADPTRPCRIVTHRSLGYELKGAPDQT